MNTHVKVSIRIVTVSRGRSSSSSTYRLGTLTPTSAVSTTGGDSVVIELNSGADAHATRHTTMGARQLAEALGPIEPGDASIQMWVEFGKRRRFKVHFCGGDYEDGKAAGRTIVLAVLPGRDERPHRPDSFQSVLLTVQGRTAKLTLNGSIGDDIATPNTNDPNVRDAWLRDMQSLLVADKRVRTGGSKRSRSRDHAPLGPKKGRVR